MNDALWLQSFGTCEKENSGRILALDNKPQQIRLSSGYVGSNKPTHPLGFSPSRAKSRHDGRCLDGVLISRPPRPRAQERLHSAASGPPVSPSLGADPPCAQHIEEMTTPETAGHGGRMAAEGTLLCHHTRASSFSFSVEWHRGTRQLARRIRVVGVDPHTISHRLKIGVHTRCFNIRGYAVPPCISRATSQAPS
jgi:hypothetical protein